MAKTFGGRWAVIASLGEGGQAHTFLVRDLADGSEGWVLKRLKNLERTSRFAREVEALTRLASPHVPPIVDHSLDKPAYLVTQYVGPDLDHEAPRPTAVLDHLDRFRQVTAAAAAAHDAGIVHRDIKPNNVVIGPDGRAFLIDFGICADAASGAVLTTTAEGFGHRAFAAPELELGALQAATAAADIYSLGKLLFWMVTGGGFIVREAIDPDRLPVDRSIRDVIIPILTNAIREDPAQRWTGQELLSRIDWALARLAVHRDLAGRGLIVITDGFGPNDEVNLSGTHSATTPPHGNPPDTYEVAEAFVASEDPTNLAEIDLHLVRYAGEGRGVVTLETDEGGSPSGQAVVTWPIHVSGDHRVGGQRVRLEPERTIELGPGQTYWVCLAVREDNTNVGWVMAAAELVPRRAVFAERSSQNAWRPAESTSGPGHALRVLARRRAT